MNEIMRIAVDTSKNVFTLHGVDAEGRMVLRRNLRRPEMERFSERHPRFEVVLDALAQHGVSLLAPAGGNGHDVL